jgi:membrane protease YdiL (CAAX protease family)
VRANGSESTLATVSTSSGQSRVPPSSSFLRLAATGEAGLLLLAWALGRWLNIDPLQDLRPRLSSLLWGVAATLPILLGLAWMLASESQPIRRLVALVVQQLGALLAPRSLLELAALAAIAGISEEVLFRGVVQVGLTQWLPPVGALLITSILFGLVHFASPAYAVLGCVMGLYLGTLFLVQGSLLAPIVAHGLYDFVALISVARRYRVLQAEGATFT